ncbi:dienelactone hydrolase family protein [Archangium primigenium]|uniref:dienelactone hydrolase family protein n=1 Tax=[Archangium] primigenium TaxID=2792470 RepID=UPI00195A1329|nr:hypothetical protein [Archangium primigenium]MBM7112165.1 hypothetical protein [Archangium primigenium]
MRPRSRARRWWLGGVGALLLAVGLAGAWIRPGLSFVARAAGFQDGLAGRLARWDRGPVTLSDLDVPSRHGPLRARLHRPARPGGRTVLLVPGVHAEGVDEPRLNRLAGDLAAQGLTVLTLELPDLLRYQLTPRAPDMIEDAVRWAAGQPALAPDGRVGLMGISFSGGLSLVAAGRPALAGALAFTVSLGGHGDLARVLAFLCTGVQADGQARRPHDYGVVILLLNLADQLVPPAQVEPLREGIRTFLRASHLAMHDPRRAEETFAEARRQRERLPEPAGTLLGHVNARDVAALGPVLAPHVKDFAGARALSPEGAAPPTHRVFLLHGAEDTVVPALEAERLARALEPRTRVWLLRSPLIGHAELGAVADPWEVLRLAAFWAAVLDA